MFKNIILSIILLILLISCGKKNDPKYKIGLFKDPNYYKFKL